MEECHECGQKIEQSFADAQGTEKKLCRGCGRSYRREKRKERRRRRTAG